MCTTWASLYCKIIVYFKCSSKKLSVLEKWILQAAAGGKVVAATAVENGEICWMDQALQIVGCLRLPESCSIEIQSQTVSPVR